MTIDRAALAAVLAENFAGEWDIFKETATCFLDSLKENIKTFKLAFATQDVEAMVRISHRIKGEASLFHKPSVHLKFGEIEANARKGMMPSRLTFDEAEKDLFALDTELREVLSGQFNQSA